MQFLLNTRCGHWTQDAHRVTDSVQMCNFSQRVIPQSPCSYNKCRSPTTSHNNSWKYMSLLLLMLCYAANAAILLTNVVTWHDTYTCRNLRLKILFSYTLGKSLICDRVDTRWPQSGHKTRTLWMHTNTVPSCF